MPGAHTETDTNFDPSIQTEEIGFRKGQLVDCSACGRANPPDRLRCLYCAAALEIKDPGSVRFTFRKLDPWEKGWNVVVTGVSPDASLAEAANKLSMDPLELSEILDSGMPLAVARVESEGEAGVIAAAIADLGLSSTVIGDLVLEGTRPPIRLGGIDVTEKLNLIDFNTREIIAVLPQDIALIVMGTIQSGKTESVEKRRRGKTKLLDETATAADEPLIDIYSRDHDTGFRIHMTGFDFYCLGSDKAMVATENMRRLAAFLKERCPNARLVTGYDEVRHLLFETWPIETQKDHKGLVYAGFGKRELGASESTSNLRQFTKFSRLQWHLL